jgi:hypothetical protein
MVRYRCAFLAVLLCIGCGSKPTSEASGKLSSQKSQAVNSSTGLSTQTSQGAVQPQGKIEARAVLVPAPAEDPKPPIAHEVVATIPDAQRILFAAASPTAEEVFVLAQVSNDTYGGAFFVVRLDGTEKKVEAVMDGTNLADPDAPVWSPDGATAYFVFDNGNFLPPSSESGHGLFTWDRTTGKVTQILKDSIGGLAISADGTLAGFWDYSAGNKLTVYNLKMRQVMRALGGLIHTADDLVLSGMAFTPDGKSLLARLYVPREDPVVKYDFASGTIAPFAEQVQSFVTVGDSVYLLQFAPVPFTAPENKHRLTKWTAEKAEPVTAVADFPYMQLSGSHGSPWVVGESAAGYNRGAAIYDTRSGQMQAAGKSCGSAVVTLSGKVLYVFGNELVANAAVCSGPLPRSAKQQ